jgi:hypothetical protein
MNVCDLRFGAAEACEPVLYLRSAKSLSASTFGGSAGNARSLPPTTKTD